MVLRVGSMPAIQFSCINIAPNQNNSHLKVLKIIQIQHTGTTIKATDDHQQICGTEHLCLNSSLTICTYTVLLD